MASPTTTRPVVLAAILIVMAWSADAQLPTLIEPLGPGDVLKSRRQREQVQELARRRLGTPLRGGSPRDLEILQRLLDSPAIARDDVFGLQSMGVVLGDVMAEQLPLAWVVVNDELGRSRALRYRDSDVLFFPVTMISRRVQAGERVDVRALYDSVSAQVEALGMRRRNVRVPRARPPRPGPDAVDD